jgi:deazaflavin-dependent oxidoreductase (nitroreductase family)
MKPDSDRNWLTPVAIWIGGLTWVPRILKQITALDKLFTRITRGRWSFVRLAGLPSMMLTLIGRKSGEPRSTPVLCVPYQDGYLIAGSNFGGPKQPIWVLNLRAAIEDARTVGVTFHGVDLEARAHECVGPEREVVWAHMNRTWPNYAKYAERSDRVIPVFLLEPTRAA